MKLQHSILLALAVLLALIISISTPLLLNAAPHANYFVVTPYLQLGKSEQSDSFSINWISVSPDTKDLSCSYQIEPGGDWKSSSKIQRTLLNGRPDLNLFTAELSKLAEGKSVHYKVSLGSEILFESSFSSSPRANSPFKFDVLGDCGRGSHGEARIAAKLKEDNPPIALITGDIVYTIGTVGFYLKNFFPYFNSSDAIGKERGSAIMQSTVFVGCAGNHDIASGGYMDARNLDVAPDSMSYFTLFDQPLNGPISKAGPNTPQLYGSKQHIDRFLEAAGPKFPRMANFWFEYGDAHFLVLDGNEYMDWTDPSLRDWVEKNLKKAKTTWKFVLFHQPGFNSDVGHREEQRMRHLADVFERTGVDVCFSGHSHSYQRSMPLHFSVTKNPDKKEEREIRMGYVPGEFKLDRTYDGTVHTKPDGVIYIVTGAAGAPLTPDELELNHNLWLPFTSKFACRKHSFSSCKIEGKRLSIKQIADDGVVLDQFALTKD